MGEDELSIPGTIVKKSNSIIRTRVTVKDLEGSRILAHLISCIHTDDINLEQAYTVAAKDILPHLGGGRLQTYQSHLPRTSSGIR